ncbi:U-scoloptoxin(05)-Sm1a-like [Oratosquilla oratoria]|uniref:U-scoloptoxin(05)-Sm1a-like n=1 Tax=Oratosquilla oratoria TaxID=337810 RepID=UPI003F7635C2
MTSTTKTTTRPAKMTSTNSVVVLFAYFALLLVFGTKGVEGINCYVCSSKNGSDVNCGDPYHPARSTYSVDCQVPKEHHIGNFPANYCVKIIGTSVNGEDLIIRTCVLENMDSQCGVFRFSNEQMTGCILTCDFDGCNAATPRVPSSWLLPLLSGLWLFSTAYNKQ